MGSMILALFLIFQQTNASFGIESIVFVNASEAKISTKQYPKAPEIASKLHGRFAKIVGQTINSHNHSKWVIESLHNASIKLKVKEHYLSICPVFKIPGAHNPIQFHYISSVLDFEEYQLWIRLREHKEDKFLAMGITKPSFGPRMVYLKSVQCLQALRLIDDPRLVSRTAREQANSLLNVFILSPEWMASVFSIVKKRIKQGELIGQRRRHQAVGTFEDMHIQYHVGLASTAFTSMLNLSESSFRLRMNYTRTTIALTELLLFGSFLSIGHSFRSLFVNLLIETIQLKVKTFVNVAVAAANISGSSLMDLHEKLWVIVHDEIAKSYFKGGSFGTLHFMIPRDQIFAELEVDVIQGFTSIVNSLRLN